jgi:Tfp pilus assembly ATPase PilU
MALDLKASDIIISANCVPSLKIMWEIKFIEWKRLMWKEDMQDIVFSTMAEWQRKRFVKEKELDYGIGFWKYRFRVNAFMTRNGMWIVCRPIATKVPEFDDLGLPESVKKFSHKRMD